MKLRLVPVSLSAANEFVAVWHRHHPPVPGHKFSVGVADESGVLRGVCIVGRPVARMLDDGDTLEVIRTATDGTKNANSMLYGAAARAAFAMGYTKVITYTMGGESGSSLKAADWKPVAQRPPRRGWHTPSRPRTDQHPTGVARTLWAVGE